MTAISTLTRLATDVVGHAVHTVRHPIASAGQAAGHVTGTVRSVAGRVVGGDGRPDDPIAAEAMEAKEAEKAEADPPEPAPPRRPGRPKPEVATEPKAPSRNSAHGGPGDDRADDWREELDEIEVVRDADLRQPDTADGIDPSLTKEIKAEAEMMSKASDPPTKD